ncbi:hypothetical protein ILUMI_18788 [Ignelater luminosus]|uniref:Dihydropteridine reductase n=1 Tax=Ignelater luminosus TaxID=2038154 RepID=A0A8K0G0J2_IGNLU|nr:hypothetical protein ILUMI_18788 [Ignelater luminosus]
MSERNNRVIIYGGNGALGSKCVFHFKMCKWWVGSVDLQENPEADFNILVTYTDSLPNQEEQVLNELNAKLKNEKVDAIICVAGGWTAGNIKKDFAKNTELMWCQNVCSSIIAASITSRYLKEGGLLTLTGASSALRETPVEVSSSLPSEAVCVAILPVILDTPMNRIWMPKSDMSNWTPLEEIVELVWRWCNKIDRPANGSLLQVITKDFKTQVNCVHGLLSDEVSL